jgi:hypothetical protein
VSFDRAFYERYYENPKTRVSDRESIASLARGIGGFASWWGLRVRRALDVGAGAGLMRDALRKEFPRATIVSTEVSAYACEKYGHRMLDIGRARLPGAFDLIICQAVLTYLDDDACTRAIDNIGAMSRGLLYLESITAKDLREVCDTTKTDARIYERSARFYETRLARHFVKVGAGLFASKKSALTFYDLERASSPGVTRSRAR